MLQHGHKILFLVFSFVFVSLSSIAQQRTERDTILLGAVVENGDTVAMVYLPEVDIIDKISPNWVKRQNEYNRLRYNVFKVYPYAVIAAGVFKDAEKDLAQLSDKRARKEYIKSKEREMKSKFKGDLESMTITQGQILVKLINRQTGQNCYHILKEMKGGFNAFLYQSLALLFSNSLKKEYDPNGEDYEMEKIVRELEASNYYKYYYARQQAMMQSKKN